MSPWEEIWAQAEASLFQLWEKSCLLSILPQTGAGWGRVFNPFLLNALCKINPQETMPKDLESLEEAVGGEFLEDRGTKGTKGAVAAQEQLSV